MAKSMESLAIRLASVGPVTLPSRSPRDLQNDCSTECDMAQCRGHGIPAFEIIPILCSSSIYRLSANVSLLPILHSALKRR